MAIAAITAGAAALRLIDLGSVSPDPFYDAAVRSMALSLHNFFLGAFEPGGSVSIDKPPVDLWLQVASVKLLGFSSTTLKLPEAFAGIASVPLLFAAVRRMWSPAAGMAAAVGMAVLPVEVITARSDTMDAVMMVLLVLALLFVARAADDGSMPWLLAAAAALGLAFNVKLLESLVALPGIALFAYLGLPGRPARRLLKIGLAGLVYIAVSLSWLTATLLVPAGERPYAIGSSNGSAWNAAFVFNGTERLGGKSPEPQFTVYEAGHKYPVATQEERDHIPITPPSATRLLTRIGPLSGERLGMEVLVALLLGIPALLWGVLRPDDLDEVLDAEARALRSRRAPARKRRPPAAAGAGEGASAAQQGAAADHEGVPPASAAVAAAPAASPAAAEQQADAEPRSSGVAVAGPERDPLEPAEKNGRDRKPPAPRPPAEDPRERVMRLRRATAAGIGLWMLSGLVLFSDMARLHPRYVEGFTPAVAAMFGIGVAWAASPKGRWRLAFLVAALAASVFYAERLLYGRPGEWWLALAAAIAAIALALLARSSRESARGRWLLAPAGVLALTCVSVLMIPFGTDTRSIETHVTDAGYVGALPTEEQRLVSSYLRAHQGSAYYETASLSATQIGSLIVQDGRPILVLTTYGARVFTPVARLKQLIAQGKVRYAFLNSSCSRHGGPLNPACSEPAKWVREHGTDVSREAGLRKGGILWLLPGAKQ